MGTRKTKGRPRGRPFLPGDDTRAIARAAARRRWGYCDHCSAFQPRARGRRWAAMVHEAGCPVGIEQARMRTLGALRAAWEQAGCPQPDEYLIKALDRGQRPDDVPALAVEMRKRLAAEQAAEKAERKAHRDAEWARKDAERKAKEVEAAAKHRAESPTCPDDDCRAYRRAQAKAAAGVSS